MLANAYLGLSLPALFMYASALALLVVQLAKPTPRLQHWASLSIAAGLVCHALLLLQQIVNTQHALLFLTPTYTISLTSWVVLVLSLILGYLRVVWVLNILALLFASFSLIVSLLTQPTAAQAYNLPSMGILLHIVLSIAAYCTLLLASLHSLIIYWQSQQIRHPNPQHKLLGLVPPLVTMEKLLFDLISIGFVVLTAALAIGWYYVHDLLAQHLAHKTFFSVLAWLVFGALIVARYYFGLRGKYAIRYTLIGFALLLVGFIGSKLVLSYLLQP